MSSATERYEAWRLANHPCYTASPQQGFEAGYTAGATDMRERAAVLLEQYIGGIHGDHLRNKVLDAIRALSPSPTPEEQA